MGIDLTFGKAYAKAAIAAGQRLPQSGNVFITMMDKYKEAGERCTAGREAWCGGAAKAWGAAAQDYQMQDGGCVPPVQRA